MVPIKFRVAQLKDLLKYNEHPQNGPTCCRERLISLINDTETREKEEDDTVEAEQIESQKGLARLHSLRDPVLRSPCKKIWNGAKPAIPQWIMQLRCIWKAKIEHYLYIEYPRNGDDTEHLFTFPFVTSDNSLHTFSQDLNKIDKL
jgi:hypothetical protein